MSNSEKNSLKKEQKTTTAITVNYSKMATTQVLCISCKPRGKPLRFYLGNRFDLILFKSMES